jgi:hypothetical protein
MSSSLKQKVKKSRRASSPAASLFSGNHTSFASMEFQLKMDRPIPLAAENPKIDIMKTRYFFLALMSTVNDCMSFPPLCLRFSSIIKRFPIIDKKRFLENPSNLIQASPTSAVLQ